jgi:alpha-L-fucosidase
MYGADFKYQDFVKDFSCELFDPNEWATLFRQSGARYVVLTSKHLEGFTLWRSAESWNWNVMDVGPHRDLAGDLNKAVKAKGLKMGYYYSLYEWFNPLYHADVNKYVDEHMIPVPGKIPCEHAWIFKVENAL